MGEEVMHILVVNPYLVGNYSLGGAKRIFRMMRYFARTEKVSLACFSDNLQSSAHYWSSEIVEFCEEIITVPLKHMGTFRRVMSFIFGRHPLSVYFHESPELKIEIEAFAKRMKVDLVHVEFFDMATSVLGMDAYVPRVLVSQEVLSLARESDTDIAMFKGRVQVPRIKRYEREIAAWFDRVYCITGEEQAYLRGLGVGGCGLFPHVVDTTEFQPSDYNNEEDGALLFVGNFDHSPNLDAVKWFMEEIAPVIRLNYPSMVLHIVGPNLDDSMFGGLDNSCVRIHGVVEDLNRFHDIAAVFINPIVSGGGMRGKVLEAMAKAKAIVSTRLGVQGIDVRDDNEVLLAEDPGEFADAVTLCLKDRQRRMRLGQNARKRVCELYDEGIVFGRQLNEYRNIIKEKAEAL